MDEAVAEPTSPENAAAAADPGHEADGRDAARGSLAFVYLFNIVVTAFLCRRYLSHVPEGSSVAAWMSALLALLSTAVLVNGLVLMVVWPVSRLVKRWWFTLVVAPVLFAILNLFIYADSVVFGLFRFHINGMVIAILTAPAAEDSFTAGIWPWLWGTLVFVLLLGAELGFSLGALRLMRRKDWFPRLERRRHLAPVACALLAVVVLDKTVYAWADIVDRTEFMRGRQLFPFYPAITCKRFASRHLGVDIVRRESMRVNRSSGSLDYPKAPLVFPEDGPRPNVVIVLLEGARFDGFRPDVVPFIHRFGRENIACEKHVTAGNATRFGVFGLMYGLHSIYFDRFFAERRGPVIVGELKKLGYAFRILGSANMDFSEFRKTCFVETVESISDKWHDDISIRHLRDVKVTDLFIEFLDEPGLQNHSPQSAQRTQRANHSEPSVSSVAGRAGAGGGRRPFFAFLFYDASHQPYLYPPEHGVFPVDIAPGDIDFVSISRDPKRAGRLVNRYFNALHYDDAEVERVVKALEERKLLENTLVFIMGDHGEEFGEAGHVGHTCSFNRWQSHTMMAAHVPGVKGRTVTRITSHVDVVPTILSHMQVANPVSDYSLGAPLTSEGRKDTGTRGFAVVGSYFDAAVLDDEVVMHFGLEVLNSRLTVRDWSWEPVPDPGKAIEERRDVLLQVMKDMRHFVK